MPFQQTSRGVYRSTTSTAVVQKTRSSTRPWMRTGGNAAKVGYYRTRADAFQGVGRKVWRAVTKRSGWYERVDGWRVTNNATRGARGCWQLVSPAGELQATTYGSRQAAQRAAPRLSGEMSGGASPRREVPNKATRAAEAAGSMRRQGVTLRAVRSRRRTKTTARQAQDRTLEQFEQDLRRVYGLVRAGRQWAKVAEIRPRLRELGYGDRIIQLRAVQLYDAGRWNLSTEDNSKVVTAEDQQESIKLGTDRVHLWKPFN